MVASRACANLKNLTLEICWHKEGAFATLEGARVSFWVSVSLSIG